MTSIESIFQLSSAAILGIFLGAQIAEACLLVPHWKELTPEEFFDQFKSSGPRNHRFFAPLTIAATGIPFVTVAIALIRGGDSNPIAWIMGGATMSFFATFFLYFKAANQMFADGTLSGKDLADELQRWGNWHWTRIGFEAIAFGCSLVLLLNS